MLILTISYREWTIFLGKTSFTYRFLARPGYQRVHVPRIIFRAPFDGGGQRVLHGDGWGALGNAMGTATALHQVELIGGKWVKWLVDGWEVFITGDVASK